MKKKYKNFGGLTSYGQGLANSDTVILNGVADSRKVEAKNKNV